MKRLRDLLASRRVRPSLKPPAPACPVELCKAAREVALADQALKEVRARGEEVDAHAERAERMLEENNLGPSLWRLVEGRMS